MAANLKKFHSRQLLRDSQSHLDSHYKCFCKMVSNTSWEVDSSFADNLSNLSWIYLYLLFRISKKFVCVGILFKIKERNRFERFTDLLFCILLLYIFWMGLLHFVFESNWVNHFVQGRDFMVNFEELMLKTWLLWKIFS